MKMKLCSCWILTFLAVTFTSVQSVSAFVPMSTFTQHKSYDVSLALTKPTIDNIQQKQISGISTVIGVSSFLYPLAALAAETQGENYEYGAVNAPIAIPLVGGLLAILTALIPVFFKGGEQAFEEMKERDADSFGKSNSVLNRKK